MKPLEGLFGFSTFQPSIFALFLSLSATSLELVNTLKGKTSLKIKFIYLYFSVQDLG